MLIQIDNNFIDVKFSLIEKILGIHGDFKIDRNDITQITKEKPEQKWNDIRLPGTYLPGVVKAGSYWTTRGWEYWNISKTRKYPITITLKKTLHKKYSIYKKIVLGVSSLSLQESYFEMMQNAISK